MNLHFYSYSESSDDYGSVGSIKNICYIGTCVNDFENITTYNCSLACLNKIENCFDGENPCIKKECEEYPGSNRKIGNKTIINYLLIYMSGNLHLVIPY